MGGYYGDLGCASRFFCDIPTFVTFLLDIINQATGLLAALAIVYFFVGLIRYIREAGNSEAQQAGRQMMFWGLIAIVVIFCIGGILLFLKDSFVG